MNFKIGDLVTRKSYDNDTVFKILRIDKEIAYLKGCSVRLLADSNTLDLEKLDNYSDTFSPCIEKNDNRDDFFYLPGRILHIDGDNEYLEKCLKYYKDNGVFAIGKKINENDIANQLLKLLKDYKPDIVIITGHDAYLSKKGNKDDINNYKNTKNFIKAVRVARQYENSQEKLVIIAGACQSHYEELIKAGANFASSPKRVNIHALDPAIIALNIALTKRNIQLNVKEILEKTKYGPNGMGGISTTGLMYVGYPR